MIDKNSLLGAELGSVREFREYSCVPYKFWIGSDQVNTIPPLEEVPPRAVLEVIVPGIAPLEAVHQLGKRDILGFD